MSRWSNPCAVQSAPSCRDLLQIRALCFSLGHAGKPLPLDDLRHQGARPKPPQRQSVERALLRSVPLDGPGQAPFVCMWHKGQ